MSGGDGTGGPGTPGSGGPPGKGTPPDADPGQRLGALREQILEVDGALVDLVARRRELVLEIGRLKAQLGMPVLDPSREAAVVRRAAALARDRGVDEELMRDVIWRIMASAREEQEGSP